MSRKDQSRKYYIGRSDKALAVGAMVRVQERDQASSTHTKQINPDKRDLIINIRKSHFLRSSHAKRINPEEVRFDN